MNTSFDIFNRVEKPTLVLSKPNKSSSFALGTAYDIELELNYNDLSVLTFIVPKMSKYGISTENYDQIEGKKLVFVEDTGWFKLENPSIVSDGIMELKACTAYSLETEFKQKTISSLSGTYKFYDPIEPETSLLGIIINEIPSWSLGNIDASLQQLYRTFQIDDENLYSFMMSNVSQAYECIFTFNTFNKEVNVASINNIGSDTNIFLSFDNLLKKVNIEENSKEIITALKVFGGNDLTIRSVNPNGSDTEFDFSHFKNTDWITQELIDALDDYEILVVSLDAQYTSNLILLKTAYSNKLSLTSELATLKGELLALEGVQKVRIQQSLALDDIYSQIVSKNIEINTKNNQINDEQNYIDSIDVILTSINTQLKLSNNFTLAQLEELDTITIEGTYQDSTFIQTDLMTEEEKTDVAQELYDFGAGVLSRISQPRYSFKIDSTNFMFLKDYEQFTGQLELGDFITISIREDFNFSPILLRIKYSFENDSDFSLVFGNRNKLDSEYTYEDLFDSVIQNSTTISFQQFQYADWRETSKDSVTSFINSALDASTNNLISSDNQAMLFNENGFRLRESDGSGGYLDEQIWIVNNMIALTNDGFQTSELAIGKIVDDRYGEVWGIAGNLIIGRILAGNNLRIENSANQFILDENGCVLTDASFTLVTTSGKGKIILDADVGIKVQGNSGGSFVDKFYVDINGNVIFSGTLSGANGTFSGTITASNIIGNIITGGTIIGTVISGVTGEYNGAITTPNLIINKDGDDNGSLNLDLGSNYISFQGTYTTGGNSLFIGKSFSAGGSISNLERIDMFAGWLYVYNNLYVSSSILIGGSQVATQLWVKNNTGDITSVNDGTGLNGGGSSGSVTLSLDTSYTDDRYCRNAGNQEMKFQVYGGFLEVFVNGSYEGHALLT